MCQIYLSSLVECQALIFPNKQNPTFPLLISPAHAAAHVHFDPRGGGRGGGSGVEISPKCAWSAGDTRRSEENNVDTVSET